MSVNSPDLKNIRSLDLSSCSLKNVDIISNLTNLTNLNLKFNYGVENLDGLANLTNLTELSIQSDSIKNVDFLAKLTKIKHFYFSGGENIENMDNDWLPVALPLTNLCLSMLIYAPGLPVGVWSRCFSSAS